MYQLQHLIFTTLAQAEGSPDQPNLLIQLLPMILLFGGLYFLMIAPQQKKQKQHKKMVEELQRGDHVVTTGGIYGEITSVKPDRFVLKIADSTRVELNRNFVQSKGTPSEE